jgi:hypothetical protein
MKNQNIETSLKRFGAASPVSRTAISVEQVPGSLVSLPGFRPSRSGVANVAVGRGRASSIPPGEHVAAGARMSGHHSLNLYTVLDLSARREISGRTGAVS